MGLSEHQISRRDLIKKSAVAGAIIWSAPVIESVTSRAAAQSTGCSSANFSASWIYVVYTYASGGGTATSYIGFSKGDTTACTDASYPNNGTNTSVSVTCSSVKYTIVPGASSPAEINENGIPLTYAAPNMTGCQLFTISGGQVDVAPSYTKQVQIVAVFCFGGNMGKTKLTAVCVSGASGGCFANCD